MLNRHVQELLQVYQCLFRDIGNTYPELRSDFELDSDHLTRLVNSRGINVFCIDLPAAGKHFDKCLSEGMYSTSGLPLTKRCPRSVMYPQFLRGLHERVFHQSGGLKEDCDVEAILFLRQLYYCAKKVELDCPLEIVLDTVKDFFETDNHLPDPEGFWESDQPTNEEIIESYTGFGRSLIYSSRVGDDGSHLQVLLHNLDIVAGIISSSLGPYRPEDWSFKHGPGAVAERKGCVNKYQFVNWSDRLESAFAYADFGYHNHAAWARHVAMSSEGIGRGMVSSDDPCSRLISVRKTLKAPRLIAAEPSEHQWCQQNIWDYFRSRTRDSWISKFVLFQDQSRNQELAKRGSVDGSLATLDLSEASDRVTCHFVGNLFRSNLGLLKALQSSRTRRIVQDINPDIPHEFNLKKFSTMGSACTFPVESLGFLAVALAATITSRGLRCNSKSIKSLEGEVAVFGDDIIIPVDSRVLMVEALEVLDFKVNLAKSFWSGCFRESCGVDAFRGVDISPEYWRSPTRSDPESISSALTVSNSFYKRCYWHAAAHIRSTIRRAFVPDVPVGSGAFGKESFLGLNISGFSRRLNFNLQKDQVRLLTLAGKQERIPSGCDSMLLQYFTEAPEPSSPWKAGVAQRPRLRLCLGWVDVENLSSDR
jgi:hypothetical protein